MGRCHVWHVFTHSNGTLLENLFHNMSLFSEAEYTFRLQKDFIPLLLQTRYVADGWLGAMVGNKLYFDFSSSEKFQESLEGLVKEIGDRGRVNPGKGIGLRRELQVSGDL